MIPLGDNMPCIADHPIIKQKIATKNKKLVLIIFLCNFDYFWSKQTNLFQVQDSHFLFANHIRKQVVESYIKCDLLCQVKLFIGVFKLMRRYFFLSSKNMLKLNSFLYHIITWIFMKRLKINAYYYRSRRI